MDAEEFRKRGREMVDYIADYMTSIKTRHVIPDVEPGYLRQLLPGEAPLKGEDWTDIMADVERAIMPGIAHWQHPDFHAYFPAGNSYPSILADMLSDAIGCIGFSWAASPACTELEMLMMDWMGKLIGLPEQFLHTSGRGGGCLQGSASDAVLVALLSARHRAMRRLKQEHPAAEDGHHISRLVGYCSKLAHSCVEKAGIIGLVKLRHLDVDDKFALRGSVLEEAIQVCATLGTTGVCSFDNIDELGRVASREGLYLHVDAAYAGNALICPEFSHLIQGIENVNSLAFNPNKWLQVNFDCTLMWVNSSQDLTSALNVDPLYLQHKHEDQAIDFRHWGVPLSRRFRALKLWFVMRTYGIEGLRARIREHCRLAKIFKANVLSDDRFEVVGDVTMGLVCFRLQGVNSQTQKLHKIINESRRLHVVPAMLNEKYVIRFALCTEHAKEADVDFAWKMITCLATQLLSPPLRRDSNKDSDDKMDFRPRIISEDKSTLEMEDDIVFDHQRDELQRMQMMKAMLFKMVSDPKCYNPRILRSLNGQIQNFSVNKQGYRPAMKSSSSLQHQQQQLHQNNNHQQQQQQKIKSEVLDPVKARKSQSEESNSLISSPRNKQKFVF
ncbi:aromatic-L-amino-acid decarboxylase [Elysia marginata]|uniref:Aromatic-L-amino-acid decarboxylase n=1 Tax=Elysia marginata TaxID=1093978 RepID=A0AAV4JRJ4_9GAST|nr:aromatic-L-amino-acid decarboxylase [Elysia marginata]